MQHIHKKHWIAQGKTWKMWEEHFERVLSVTVFWYAYVNIGVKPNRCLNHLRSSTFARPMWLGDYEENEGSGESVIQGEAVKSGPV